MDIGPGILGLRHPRLRHYRIGGTRTRTGSPVRRSYATCPAPHGPRRYVACGLVIATYDAMSRGGTSRPDVVARGGTGRYVARRTPLARSA
ncbi:hypothetical protein STTU_1621 [Streptomyces sp. Tu6071]|nr:hypothetical protein STTU_1621 [Streptomyces sp. Tu6071]